MLYRYLFSISLWFVVVDCRGAECSPRDALTRNAAPSLLQVRTRGGSSEDPASVKITPPPSNGTSVEIMLFIRTSSQDFAGTESGARISFLIHDSYTEEVPLVEHAKEGSNVTWHARLSAWPSKIRINGTADGWTIDSIELRSDEINATLLNNFDVTERSSDVAGNHTISSDGLVELAVPELNVEVTKQCVTRHDPRTVSWAYTSVPSGTPCIFGLDDRDEGSHCVYDNGQYGSYGWCYTDEARNSFGSCSEDCPLQGDANILGKKIDAVLDTLDAAAEKHDDILKHLNTTTSPPADAADADDTNADATNAVNATANATSKNATAIATSNGNAANSAKKSETNASVGKGNGSVKDK